MRIVEGLKGLAVGMAFGVLSWSASAADTDLPLRASWKGDAPGGAPPWVNVLMRDFSDAGPLGDFEWIRPTVEVQITTAPGHFDDPGGSCCPVEGKGNLTGSENLRAIWLNVSSRLEAGKLKIYWTGNPMPPFGHTFPAAGLQPSRISVRQNGFSLGSAGKFDIQIEWNGAHKLGQDVDWSKLLFVYDDPSIDLTPEDFQVTSSGSHDAAAPFLAIGHVRRTSGAEGSAWIKQ